jgi:hypothetical protein
MSKETEDLTKILHNIAGNQPDCDPFSYEGAQEWHEWTESCRTAENELRKAGEKI